MSNAARIRTRQTTRVIVSTAENDSDSFPHGRMATVLSSISGHRGNSRTAPVSSVLSNQAILVQLQMGHCVLRILNVFRAMISAGAVLFVGRKNLYCRVMNVSTR